MLRSECRDLPSSSLLFPPPPFSILHLSVECSAILHPVWNKPYPPSTLSATPTPRLDVTLTLSEVEMERLQEDLVKSLQANRVYSKKQEELGGEVLVKRMETQEARAGLGPEERVEAGAD